MARSSVRIKLSAHNVDSHVGRFGIEFAKTFGTDVMRQAKRSLKRAPRKKASVGSGPGGMTDEELKAYRQYVSRRRYWQRMKRLGRLPKKYGGEIPKTYQLPPNKARRWDPRRKKVVPLVPEVTAPPGRPPYLHESRPRLKNLIRFHVDMRRVNRSRFARRVIIGPAKTSTKSEAQTLKILEYGRGGTGPGNPYMRPAFAKSLKKVREIGQYAARRAKRRSRR